MTRSFIGCYSRLLDYGFALGADLSRFGRYGDRILLAPRIRVFATKIGERSRLWAPLLSLVFFFGSEITTIASAEEPHGHGHHDAGPTEEEKVVKKLADAMVKTPQVPAFQRYDGLFRALCVELDRDGRRAQIFDLATAAVLKEGVTCPECRMLFKVVANSCKEQKKREVRVRKKTPKAEEEETEAEAAPTVPPPIPTRMPARIPSTEALDISSRLATTIDAQAPAKIKEQTKNAMLSWAAILTRKEEKSPGFADYCEILATYLTGPWLQEKRTQEWREKLRPKDKEDEDSVDTLFEE